jgi:hypothetical protein
MPLWNVLYVEYSRDRQFTGFRVITLSNLLCLENSRLRHLVIVSTVHIKRSDNYWKLPPSTSIHDGVYVGRTLRRNYVRFAAARVPPASPYVALFPKINHQNKIKTTGSYHGQ